MDVIADHACIATSREAFGKRFVCAAELATPAERRTRAAMVHAYFRNAGRMPTIAGRRKLQPFFDRENAEMVIRAVFGDPLLETAAQV